MRKPSLRLRFFKRSSWTHLAVCVAISIFNLSVFSPGSVWFALLLNGACWWQWGLFAQNLRKWDMDDWEWTADLAELRHRERMMLAELESLKDEAAAHLALLMRKSMGARA